MKQPTMSKLTGQVIRVAVALALVFGLIAALPTTTAQAASQVVVISESQTADQIRTAIQSAIDTTARGAAIGITGTKNNLNGSIRLNIPAGITVYWGAELTGDYQTIAYGLLDLSGSGKFVIRSGIISNTTAAEGSSVRSDGVDIEVEGGSVTTVGSVSSAIRSTGNRVTVSGGRVEGVYSAIRG